MADQLSPGQSFSEQKSGVATIAASASGIGGVVIQTERGPLEPVLIGGMDDYKAIYGGAYAGAPNFAHVNRFFVEGGSALYVMRALNADAVAASLQLLGDGSANSALLSASSKGDHGNALKITTTRDDTLVATTGAIAASAQTSAVLSSVARVYVGAQVNIKDATTPANHVRVVVLRVDTSTKTIYFASATPSGAITTGNAYLEEWSCSIARNGVFARSFTQLAQSTLAGALYFKSKMNTGDPREPIVVTTDNALAASVTVDPRPVAITSVSMASGSDGTAVVDADFTGDSSSKTGLYGFDVVDDVNQICIPGRCTQAVHQALLAWCANRRQSGRPVCPILSANEPQTSAQVLTYVTTTANLYSDEGGIYAPWIQTNDPITGLRVDASPETAIMGMYARVDQTRGPNKAPAGTPDGLLRTALGPTRKISITEYNSLYPARINAILAIKGRGTCVFGSRTLATGDFDQINVRRMFNFLEHSIYDSTPWVAFENNDELLWAKIRKSVDTFLLGQWRAGRLKGKTPSEAFYVICDEGLNPPSAQRAGKLKARIGAAVANPAEFIEWLFERDTRALEAEIAAAGTQ